MPRTVSVSPTRATLPFLLLWMLVALLFARPEAAAGPVRGVGFDGTDDFIAARIPAAMASNYTFAAWVYLCEGGNAGARAAVLSAEGDGQCGTTAEVLIRSADNNSGSPQFIEFGRCNFFNGTLSTRAVPVRRWAHVAVTVSSNQQVSYFIDGTAAGTWDARGLRTALGATFTLGYNRSAGRIFNGLLGEVQVWNRQLPAAQIQAAMQRNFTATRSNLVLSYLFTETAGTVVSNSAPGGSTLSGTLRNGAQRFFANAAPAAPVVAGLTAANLTPTMASLNATINPNGAPVSYRIEWGEPGSLIVPLNVPFEPAAAGAQPVSRRLAGLEPGLDYVFRVIARNCLGASTSAFRAFTLPAGSRNEFLVTTTADGGPGSLRDAIAGANAQPPHFTNTVRFAPALGGKTVLLTNGAITVTRNVRVDASGLANRIRIDARQRNRILTVESTGALTVDSLEFTGGSDPQSGGAILCLGRLEAVRCNFFRNGAYVGGAVNVEGGNAVLADCSFSTNSAYGGGAVFAGESSLTMLRCSLTGNSAADGGGISLGLFDARLEECTLTGNSANYGGAISAREGSLTIQWSRLTGNRASDTGGALRVDNVGLDLGNSTLDANSAGNRGGAVWLSGISLPMSLTQCTIAGNRAGTGGGLLLERGQLALRHCTITANGAEQLSGGAGVVSPGENIARVTVTHSIIAGNANGDDLLLVVPQDNGAAPNPRLRSNTVNTFVSEGYNLVGSGNPVYDFNRPGDVIGESPRLTRLGDRGGPLPTCTPLPTSRSINGGDPAFSGPPSTDQRGQPRIRNRRVDIGATESESPALRMYYTFDGAVAQDLTGNTTSSASGATPPAWAAGRNGQAASAAHFLPGGNLSYLVKAASNPGNANAALGLKDSFTVVAWIYPADLSGDRWVLGNTGGGGEGTFHFGLRNGYLHTGFWNNDIGGVTPIPAGRWTHVALTYDRQGGTMAIYVNGRLENSDVGRRNTLGDHNLSIGWLPAAGPNTSYFVGRVDDLAIFGQSLSAGQVAALASGTVRPDETLPPADLPLTSLPGCVWNVREIHGHPRTPITVADAEEIVRTAELGTVVDYQTDQINFADPETNPGGDGFIGGDRPYRSNNRTPQGLINGDDNLFVLAARTQLVITEEDDYTFGFASDDGARLRIRNAQFISSTRLATDNPANPAHRGDTLSFPAPTGNSSTLGVAHLVPGIYEVEFLTWEITGGAFCEVFFARGARTEFSRAPLRLFNTGVDANGAILANGAVDPHYTVVVNPDRASANAYPVNPHPAWVGANSSSRWIGTRPDSNEGAVGTYTYRTTFDLTGYDPSTVQIGGRWAVDNALLFIMLNGRSVPVSGGDFRAFQAFTLEGSTAFRAGTNVLEFITRNDGGPAGLRVEFTNLVAKALPFRPLGYTGPVEMQVEVTPFIQRITNGAPLRTVQFQAKVPVGFGRMKYQWFFNQQPAAGPNIAGAQTDTLFINNATAANAGVYSVSVASELGEATGAAYLIAFTNGVSDRIVPTLTVTSPAPASLRTTASAIRFGGRVNDSGPPGLVILHVNRGGPNPVALALSAWSTEQPLEPGTNVFSFFAIDQTGNQSPVVTRTVVRVVTNRLELSIAGTGTVTPNPNGQFLEVGRTYSVRATPGAGFVFSNWTGDATCSGPLLNFVMTPGLKLRANFVPSPFVDAAGTYNGLVHEADAVRFDRSGFVTLTLTPAGAYSGSLMLGSLKIPLSGQFTLEGTATNRLARPGTNALSLEVRLDAGARPRVYGRVNDTNWAAYFVTKPAALFPPPGRVHQAGTYTFGWNALTKSSGLSSLTRRLDDDSRVLPEGDPVGSIIVAPNGQATVLTTLSDGTTGTQTVPLAGDGTIPYYLSLYGGKGVVLGWLNLQKPAPVGSAVYGSVYWARPRNATPGLFTNGFEITAETYGSPYLAPTNNRALAFTNGFIRFTSPTVPSLTNRLALGPGGTVVNRSSNVMSMSLTPANGLFSGTAREPGTGRALQFKGAVFQDFNGGTGWLLATNTSGRVNLFRDNP